MRRGAPGYHAAVFSEFRAPDLAARLRAAAVWPLGAYLLAQVYFTLYPLLAAVPRWLFETVRADLLVGLAAGLAAGLRLTLGGRPQRQDTGRPFDLPATGWLVALAAGLLLCGWTLAGMSFPWRVV
jgi:hypothetical protein